MHKLTLTRYRDLNGNPTCASDFRRSDVCELLLATKFGREFECAFSGDALFRQDDYLKPCESCIVWSSDVEVCND